MLPLTTQQVKDGVDAGDFMIDLSDYMKKKDGATKSELNTLTEILANKLDATPQHKHDIADVKDLREELVFMFSEVFFKLCIIGSNLLLINKLEEIVA